MEKTALITGATQDIGLELAKQFAQEAIAHELKGTGVQVSALCPGATKTGLSVRLSKNNFLKKKKDGSMDLIHHHS